MSDNKSRDIFYAVVAVATLIVALIGATLAYFSITAGSNEGAVAAKAAIVKVDYQDSQQISANAENLIPATFTVVDKVYTRTANDEIDDTKNRCRDDNDHEVCSIYRFTVGSEAESGINVTATLNSDNNGFTYLYYAVRDVDNNQWITLRNGENHLNINNCSGEKVDDDDTTYCYTTDGTGKKIYNDGTTGGRQAIKSLFGYDNSNNILTKNIKNISSGSESLPRTFDIVLFIKEEEDPGSRFNQNIDQGKSFQGTIIVDVPNSSYVTGVAD